MSKSDLISIQKRAIIVTQIINELGITIETNTKPLIYCKDCKYWNNETDMTYCDRTVWFGTDADDYCSFGEREDK